MVVKIVPDLYVQQSSKYLHLYSKEQKNAKVFSPTMGVNGEQTHYTHLEQLEAESMITEFFIFR